MFDYDEIDRTVRDNNLPFQKIEDTDKEILTQRLYMELYSITDHDDLLYIDVRKIKRKLITKCDNAWQRSTPKLSTLTTQAKSIM